jgi:transposase
MDAFLESGLADLYILDTYTSSQLVVLRIASKQTGHHCPTCGVWTQRVHSVYYRTVQDVPVCGVQTALRVRARKWFCDNPECSRTIFCERFEGLVERSQQKTVRLTDMLKRIAWSLGGNPGAVLARHLGIAVSRHALLARIRQDAVQEPPDIQDVRVVGIDDWAYRRGQRYGTIVCDIEHHRVLDVLPDRRVTTVAAWLRAHPNIQMVSRDRAGVYADAIRQGLPTALQVADRWHLLKNLGDTVQRYLARQRLPLRDKLRAVTAPAALPRPVPPPSPRPREQARMQRRQAKWMRVQELQHLHQAGIGLREIARQRGLSRQTIRKYLTWTELPPSVRAARTTLLDPYRQEVEQGLRASLSSAQILRRIEAQGYTGSRGTLCRYLAERRRALTGVKTSSRRKAPLLRRERVSPREAAILLTKPEDPVDDKDRAYRDQLLQQVPGAGRIRELCASFQALMKARDGEGLGGWLREAAVCGIGEMQSFAEGIRRDMAAVIAGLTSPWSQGQVEGQVNRLKTLKRQMYGRAGFILLRARVLHPG